MYSFVVSSISSLSSVLPVNPRSRSFEYALKYNRRSVSSYAKSIRNDYSENPARRCNRRCICEFLSFNLSARSPPTVTDSSLINNRVIAMFVLLLFYRVSRKLTTSIVASARATLIKLTGARFSSRVSTFIYLRFFYRLSRCLCTRTSSRLCSAGNSSSGPTPEAGNTRSRTCISHFSPRYR